MPDCGDRERANEPEGLGRLFLERASTADVAGIVALYEADAVLALPTGALAVGAAAIRSHYEQLLASAPKFAGDVRPALRSGDLALTSTRFSGGATAEIAHRQADGGWLWIADQPSILG